MASFERNKVCGCLSDNVYSPGPSVIWPLLLSRHFMTPMKQMSWHWHWHWSLPSSPPPQKSNVRRMLNIRGAKTVKEMFGVLFILWDNIARLCPRIMEHNFPLYQNYRLEMMTACVILKWKKLCLMLELNTFSAVIIKLKTSRTTPIYQESALNQNYRRYNTDRELRTYLQKNNAVKVVQQPQTDFSRR